MKYNCYGNTASYHSNVRQQIAANNLSAYIPKYFTYFRNRFQIFLTIFGTPIKVEKAGFEPATNDLRSQLVWSSAIELLLHKASLSFSTVSRLEGGHTQLCRNPFMLFPDRSPSCREQHSNGELSFHRGNNICYSWSHYS